MTVSSLGDLLAIQFGEPYRHVRPEALGLVVRCAGGRFCNAKIGIPSIRRLDGDAGWHATVTAAGWVASICEADGVPAFGLLCPSCGAKMRKKFEQGGG